MRDEDYQLVEHPRLELHIHVATKFVQVIITMRMAMSMLINVTAGMMITFLVSLTLIMYCSWVPSLVWLWLDLSLELGGVAV